MIHHFVWKITRAHRESQTNPALSEGKQSLFPVKQHIGKSKLPFYIAFTSAWWKKIGKHKTKQKQARIAFVPPGEKIYRLDATFSSTDTRIWSHEMSIFQPSNKLLFFLLNCAPLNILIITFAKNEPGKNTVEGWEQHRDNLNVKELTHIRILPLGFPGTTFLLMKMGLNTELIGVSW